uniref:Uncharacterized protein n=1 Tax=Myoviridae sp. ctu6J18 TaxID=2827714 RepID=A0A8S5TN12_9CAUD|nr:MAG TPA: hypothetical protein [Myoviridae sp. ctu6J18]
MRSLCSEGSRAAVKTHGIQQTPKKQEDSSLLCIK